MNVTPKKKRKIASLGMLLGLLALLLMLTACGNREGSGVNMNDAIVTEYVYLSQHIDLPDISEDIQIQGSVVHGDRIFYYYIEHYDPGPDTDWDNWVPVPPQIVIASMLADGTDQRQITIPAAADSAQIPGLRMTEDGNVALLVLNSSWTMQGGEHTLSYMEYDLQGNRVAYQEIQGVIPAGSDWFSVDQAFFADDGYIVLSAWGERGMDIFLLDSNLSLTGQLEMESGTQGITQLRDGRVVMMAWEEDDRQNWVNVLREIDFEAGNWGETITFSVTNVRQMFPVRDGDPFDLLIDDGTHLFGYTLATGERALILNWIESELTADWGYYVGFLDDGRISVLSNEWVSDAGSHSRGGFHTAFMTLTRTPRAELPERTIITLGGVWLSSDVRAEVIAFNRASQTHQIQVRDYSIYNTNDDWRAGNLRLLAELAVGDGPDIIWGWYDATLANRGMFADLYAFIDADPVLNRSDFFPNILAAMETADGSLSMVANSFGLETMVGMTDAVGHIQSWTLADMLELLEGTDDADMEHIMGQWLTGENFLSIMLMFSGREFIDWDEHQANLNSDAFIHLLEIAARLPQQREDDGNNFRQNFVSDYTRMRRGEQLLISTGIWNPSRYSELAAALGGDFTVLGMPTGEGGAHVIHLGQSVGINAGSDHQDEAWSFVRQFLLPDFRVEWSIPLRIDQYDAAIANAMAPFDVWVDEDGNEWPTGGGSWWVDDYLQIELQPMTEEEARGLRAIVESANMTGRFDEIIMEMVQEEIQPFFAGDRTAADTARILQNRIQTYLNEQR
ncbi:MAG: extracellular solute-binding protein [Oscillospiraceae bacterium]|nr:extracellular solute-binding protein [Oscillospiraceae bacterium]